MIKDILTNIDSNRLPIVGRGSEMNACEDARIFDLLHSRGKAAKRTDHAKQPIGIHAEMSILPEIWLEHPCCRRTDTRVSGWIFWMWRCGEERDPSGISLRR